MRRLRININTLIFVSGEIVSIGDTGSDPDMDDNHHPAVEHEYKNGFDIKLQNISVSEQCQNISSSKM